jgi:hypothetical protein
VTLVLTQRHGPWVIFSVSTNNTFTLNNDLGAAGVSGGNVAKGSSARNLTLGGNLSKVGFDNHAGNTGSNVNGGTGGAITTGASASQTTVVNVLNRTLTRIQK